VETFCLIASLMAFPAIVPTVIIWRTGRTDVYWVKLQSTPGDAQFVDWRTLDDLADRRDDPQAARPDLFGRKIQVLGYMLPFPFPDLANRNTTVGRFLLVPDPGNWLHPPHFHPGEVIDVRLNGGMTVSLIEGRVVTIRDVMSFDPMKLDRGEAMFHLLGDFVQPYAE